jgi:hypothetical protein
VFSTSGVMNEQELHPPPPCVIQQATSMEVLQSIVSLVSLVVSATAPHCTVAPSSRLAPLRRAVPGGHALHRNPLGVHLLSQHSGPGGLLPRLAASLFIFTALLPVKLRRRDNRVVLDESVTMTLAPELQARLHDLVEGGT